MATLQKIRNRAGLLVAVVIGLALFAFILGDMMGSGAPTLGKQSVAEINGKGIGVNDYLNREKSLREFYQLNAGGQSLDAELERQIQQETWRRLVRQTIMDRSYQKLGIIVSTDELKTMITGDQIMGLSGNPALSEPHPIVRQMFSNPETGLLNRQVMTNYFNALDNPQFEQEKKRWLFIEQEIVDEKMNQKYFNLVRKGFQPSSLDLKDHVTESGKSTDFTFISKPFSEISDEEIAFTESDLKQYYKSHRENYKQDASRTFQYIVFEVEPSEKDVESARYWTAQTRAEFVRTTSDELPRYVNGTSDEPFDVRYYTYDELPEIIRDSVFNASGDEVFGPYREEEAFKLTRKHDVQMRPDSVRARHILLSMQDFQGNRAAITALADSLVGVIDSGGDFNLVALTYSADESNRAIGGDLGWFTEGRMVSEFNDACFENRTGDLVTAETQFGTHIIRIEDQSRRVRKMQIASIVRNIFASDETNQDFYNRAVKFRGKATDLDKFTEQAREFGLDPRFAPNISKDQQTIPGIDDPVRITKWAYSADVNSVSNIFSQGDEKYIVAVLTEANEEGYAELDNVRAEVELAVKKEKKAEKLVEKLNEQLAGVSDLSQFGIENNENVGEATQVKFANTYVTGVGLEPYIVGAAMYLPVDQVSIPMIGESGVFVLAVTNRTEPPLEEVIDPAVKSRLKYSLESRSNFEAYNALVDAAKVQDNRLELFYN
ncbi:MAG: SurA N-terminal domain-containing protein [Bacteroidales bacterium]|nr:SurA N-terminal domain-containing protein [Bacteroidales bacterium]